MRAIAVALCASAAVDGFYLPGVAPYEYKQDEEVGIKVNKLTSTKRQVGPCTGCIARRSPGVCAPAAQACAAAH